MLDYLCHFVKCQSTFDTYRLKTLHRVQQMYSVTQKWGRVGWKLYRLLRQLQDESLIRQQNHIVNSVEKVALQLQAFLRFLGLLWFRFWRWGWIRVRIRAGFRACIFLQPCVDITQIKSSWVLIDLDLDPVIDYEQLRLLSLVALQNISQVLRQHRLW